MAVIYSLFVVAVSFIVPQQYIFAFNIMIFLVGMLISAVTSEWWSKSGYR